jgi:hypothetical protein
MAVGTKRLSVDPCLRDSIYSLVAVKAKKLRNDGCGSNFDENDVVETNAVEGIQEGKPPLNFMGFDHSLKDIMDSKRLALASKVVRDSQDSAKVVRWMTPYRIQKLV